ncbi:MAG: ParB/RepB/Spo0J family partition protein [Defluviitaleaceae bacterium]|nr:ParB/RepB/Spo0J family partition protein [Defluviitaleaceae bacterium]
MKAGLGRGLNALLDASRQDDTNIIQQPSSSGGVMMVDIRKIEPTKDQPRKYFDEAALEELAASMKEYGVISPLVVKENGKVYTIIAGERRYRAARIAKLPEVPVIVKDYSDGDILQVALIENIQRQDLTSIEEAVCYKRLMDDFFFSADDIATKVGKSKHAIISALHLLELDVRVQVLAGEGKLSTSHAKVLLQVEDGDLQLYCAEKIVEEGLSVRGTESLVTAALKEASKLEKEPYEAETPDDVPEEVLRAYRRAEDDLKQVLGSKVNIRPGKKKGRIEIEYYSPDELERLLQVLGRAGS